jgi:hypothetical protein
VHNGSNKWIIKSLFRVLADDIYMGPRCIAVRNQDIGIGLVNRFITFQTQPISIRRFKYVKKKKKKNPS